MACPKDCVILAGVGGIIPTLSRMASTYVSDPGTPLPEVGMFFGLLLFFVIGAVLAYAFSETNIRQAFILGVCAPGIITNIVAGVNEAESSGQVAYLDTLPLVSAAYAQTRHPTPFTPVVRAAPAAALTASPVERKIIVNSDLSGASAWDKKNIMISVTAIARDGKRRNIAGFPAYQQNIEVVVPRDTSMIEIRAAGIASQVELPDRPFEQAVVSSTIHVEGKRDFLWALGAKRKPKVVSIDSAVEQFE
jgi:hypothetical protein